MIAEEGKGEDPSKTMAKNSQTYLQQACVHFIAGKDSLEYD
jgi:hypothetical protein